MRQKKMSAKEFRELGYLQELNRRFLHPLGLALEVMVEDGEIVGFGEVWDARDDQEGFIFGQLSDMNPENAVRILHEEQRKAEIRMMKYGWKIQPLP